VGSKTNDMKEKTNLRGKENWIKCLREPCLTKSSWGRDLSGRRK
jgi:hypothetical protein